MMKIISIFAIYITASVTSQTLYPTLPPYMQNSPGNNPSWHAPGNQRQTLTYGKCLVDVPSTNVSPGGGHGGPGNLMTVETCCIGYEQDQRDLNSCVAVCEKSCGNGRCIEPNQCQCNSGYIQDLSGTCVPSCPSGCVNGNCAGNQCRCNPGYVLDRSSKFCVPHCPNSCGRNGNCSAPGVCSCGQGYALSSAQICEPVCKPSCGNGNCISPGQCSCFSGYVLKNETCQANCPRGCENGRCVANDVCACDIGWTLSNDRNKCTPQCNSECKNGVCARPDTCACLPGYHFIGRECKPLCKLGCIQGDCVAPDVCVCKPGFTLDPTGKECRPVQPLPCQTGYIRDPKGNCIAYCRSGCPNGYCAAPEMCVCNTGFVFLQGTCLKGQVVYQGPIHNTSSQNNPPRCDAPCLNGVCSGYNVCTCNPGYVNTPENLRQCYPYCPGGCPNGQCLSPNFCGCNNGFLKRNGVCVRN